ncbi:hypothetical protein GBFDFA_06100 [Edwardsiella anguillarum]|nr:hypothetical protein PBOPBF_06105 [Edwardsiella anguillarum]BET83702.1 hypothetical protein GHNJMD_06410 [Edwardsiella anguillarum]BET87069.1 hypothetical protein GBFDFA_06100 [Edwardsiella anguillarum]BET90495.1 hypothetical protein BIKEJJ_06105 [Edwardsiella anguillarum]
MREFIQINTNPAYNIGTLNANMIINSNFSPIIII